MSNLGISKCLEGLYTNGLECLPWFHFSAILVALVSMNVNICCTSSMETTQAPDHTPWPGSITVRVQLPQEDLVVIWNQPPNMEGVQRWKRKADRSRWIGSKLKKQGNILVLGGYKWLVFFTHPLNLKIFIEALSGFSHSYEDWTGFRSHHHIAVSRLCPWTASSPGRQGGPTF